MALHLITGYAGQEHITSADQGAYNIATYGDGNFVLNRGRKFAQTVLSNNSISISDGEAMMQGRFIKMPFGTSENISIENGTTGTKRNDLICIRYQKSSVNSTESASFVVIKGTESSSTASDPTYNTGSITDGDDTILDFPLYRVKLDGINIQTVDTLFSVKISMSEYMDNYQLPVASNTQLGGVKIGNGISKSADGTISAEVSKVGKATIGSTECGIYLDAGTPKKCKKITRRTIHADFSINELTVGANGTVSVMVPINSKMGNDFNVYTDLITMEVRAVYSHSSNMMLAYYMGEQTYQGELCFNFYITNLLSTATSVKQFSAIVIYWGN